MKTCSARHDFEVLIEAGRVLRQVQERGAPVHGHGLQAAIVRIEPVYRLLHGALRTAQQRSGHAYSHEVIDHVRPRERPAHGALLSGLRLGTLRPAQRERQPAFAHLHAHCLKIKRRTFETAVRTMIVAKLAVLAIAIFEHRRAPLAHLGVCHRVLLKPHVFAYTERDGRRTRALRQLRRTRSDGSAQRVVCVVDEHGPRRCGKRVDDAVLDAVDLPTAIQLVAEQVQQQHVVRLQLRQRACQPQLIALENTPVGGLSMQKGGCHTGIQVRSRAIAHDGMASGLYHVRKKVAYRGLTVRADDHDRAAPKLAPQIRDNVRIDIQGDLSGKIRRRTAEHMLKRHGRERAHRLRPDLSKAHEDPFPRAEIRSLAKKRLPGERHHAGKQSVQASFFVVSAPQYSASPARSFSIRMKMQTKHSLDMQFHPPLFAALGVPTLHACPLPLSASPYECPPTTEPPGLTLSPTAFRARTAPCTWRQGNVFFLLQWRVEAYQT